MSRSRAIKRAPARHGRVHELRQPELFPAVEMPLVRARGSSAVRRGPRESRRCQRALRRAVRARRHRRGQASVGDGSELDIEIVGIVHDAKYSEVKQDIPPQVFMPREAAPFMGAASFYLRSDFGRASCARPSRQVLARHDANLPIMEF